MQKIKICHVIGNFVNGGVESVIYNYFSHMDLTKYEVHIIGHGVRVQECADRFTALGFTIHNITPKSVSFAKSCKEMEAIFKQNKFDIVHSHLTEWACVPMFLAWKRGVKVRINHSHMAEKPKGLKNKVYYGIRLFFGKIFATDYLACGYDAGVYLFGKKCADSGKIMVLPNAIDYSRFKYQKEIRDAIRKSNRIEKTTKVIGHVGRFFEQKNHAFLVDLFDAYYKINPDSLLVLLGDGELFDEIKSRIKGRDSENAIWFLGNRSDVEKWYQAMDMFILPSFYEGFPVVGVEAQAAGLPCLFSDGITQEIKLSNNAYFMSLDDGIDAWASKIENIFNRADSRDEVMLCNDRFNVEIRASELDKLYNTRMAENKA